MREHLHMKGVGDISTVPFRVIISLDYYVQFKGGTEWAGKWISDSDWVPVWRNHALPQDLHGESFYFDKHTKSFFCCFNWTPPGSASGPICAYSRSQGLGTLPNAKVVLCVQRSAVDLNINRVGLCCAVVASLSGSWTLVRSEESKTTPAEYCETMTKGVG